VRAHELRSLRGVVRREVSQRSFNSKFQRFERGRVDRRRVLRIKQVSAL